VGRREWHEGGETFTRGGSFFEKRTEKTKTSNKRRNCSPKEGGKHDTASGLTEILTEGEYNGRGEKAV